MAENKSIRSTIVADIGYRSAPKAIEWLRHLWNVGTYDPWQPKK